MLLVLLMLLQEDQNYYINLRYHLINDLNIGAFMYYYNFDNTKFKTPVHPEYEIYNVPYVLKIPENEDFKRNILIVPEVLTSLFKLLR